MAPRQRCPNVLFATILALLAAACSDRTAVPRPAVQKSESNETNPADVLLPGSEEGGRPSLNDMLSMPPTVGALKLEQLYRLAETRAPTWPVTATYGTDWMTPNLVQIECELSDAKKLRCPNDGWKNFKLGTYAACKKLVRDGDAMVRWLRDSTDCIMFVHPEMQPNACRLAGTCDGVLDGVVESAKIASDFIASGQHTQVTDELVRMAIRHGKHHK